MKKLISILLAAVLFCSVLPSAALAAKDDDEFPYEWEEMRYILEDFNDYCAKYYVYPDDEEAAFIEIEGDLSRVKASIYDYAVMRISRTYFDDGYYFYWEEHECPYYVIYASYKDEWIIDSVVYVQGKAFSAVGVLNDSYVFSSEVRVYWSK